MHTLSVSHTHFPNHLINQRECGPPLQAGKREGLGDLLAANFSSRLDMALEFAKPKRQHMLASWEDGKHK